MTNIDQHSRSVGKTWNMTMEFYQCLLIAKQGACFTIATPNGLRVITVSKVIVFSEEDPPLDPAAPSGRMEVER